MVYKKVSFLYEFALIFALTLFKSYRVLNTFNQTHCTAHIRPDRIVKMTHIHSYFCKSPTIYSQKNIESVSIVLLPTVLLCSVV